MKSNAVARLVLPRGIIDPDCSSAWLGDLTGVLTMDAGAE